jgi:hypothetical protein
LAQQCLQTGELPNRILESRPGPGESESQQIGGNVSYRSHYEAVGELRCNPGDAILGIQINLTASPPTMTSPWSKPAYLDQINYLAIGCARLQYMPPGSIQGRGSQYRKGRLVHPTNTMPLWQRPPPAQSYERCAGNASNGNPITMLCPQFTIVSGFMALGTPQSQWPQIGDYIRNLGVQCAQVIGQDQLGYQVARQRTWALGSQSLAGGSAHKSECANHGATALSVGVHYGDSVIQAFSMFCGGGVEDAF